MGVYRLHNLLIQQFPLQHVQDTLNTVPALQEAGFSVVVFLS